MDKVLSVPDEWKKLLNASQKEAIESIKGNEISDLKQAIGLSSKQVSTVGLQTSMVE
jgi:hypothetical protein